MNWYPTDAELLARSVAEPAIFGELYERHSLAVRRYVVRRIGDAVGDDLAADVFVLGFRRPGAAIAPSVTPRCRGCSASQTT